MLLALKADALGEHYPLDLMLACDPPPANLLNGLRPAFVHDLAPLMTPSMQRIALVCAPITKPPVTPPIPRQKKRPVGRSFEFLTVW